MNTGTVSDPAGFCITNISILVTFCEELFLPLSVSTSLLAGESGTSAVAAELIERSSASFQEGSMKIVNFDVLVFIFRQGEDIRLRRYININIYIYIFIKIWVSNLLG